MPNESDEVTIEILKTLFGIEGDPDVSFGPNGPPLVKGSTTNSYEIYQRTVNFRTGLKSSWACLVLFAQLHNDLVFVRSPGTNITKIYNLNDKDIDKQLVRLRTLFNSGADLGNNA